MSAISTRFLSCTYFFLIAGLLMFCNRPNDKQTTEAFAESDKQEIINMLEVQAKDWSDGDLKKFMEGYWKSDSIQFIGRNGIMFGWQTTLDNYRKNFPDTIAMGKLRFEILRVNPVSADAAYLTGKFFLTRTIGDLNGIFTLVFRKIDGKWLCVYDHTS